LLLKGLSRSARRGETLEDEERNDGDELGMLIEDVSFLDGSLGETALALRRDSRRLGGFCVARLVCIPCFFLDALLLAGS
jgi:hypothetical protein